MGEVVRFPEGTKVIMGEVEKLPGSKRPRQSRKRNVGQDPLACLIKIRDELRARRAAEIAAHDAYAGYTEQIIQYQKDHPDGDDAA